MTGCPGSGQALHSLSGTVAGIAQPHDAISVRTGGRTTRLRLQVHPDCPERSRLMTQIAGLRTGQSIKCTYYKLNGRAYLCAIGAGAACH
jgi:hypothetical protein